MNRHFDLPEPVAQVFVTTDLWRRPASAPDFLREKLALQDLAEEMADRPSEVLPRLVELAMEATGAESAGISILESDNQQFRWHGLKGVLKVFEGATTPRNDSPCGVCMDRRDAILMDRPERAYAWIREANITVPEVLLVPLSRRNGDALGTLWVVSARPGLFNPSHVRVMKELAAFAALALHMIQTEERLSGALQQQATLTREMSHRVKNLFAISASMIRMTARNSATKEELVEQLSGRMQSLASANALVRRTFSDETPSAVALDEIIRCVLEPYADRKITVSGPPLPVGERGTNNIALIFHELATNSAKYGALGVENGSVDVQWAIDGKDVELAWTETGGPVTRPPQKLGFGTRLVQSTIRSIDGQLDFDWRLEGLIARMKAPHGSLAT